MLLSESAHPSGMYANQHLFHLTKTTYEHRAIKYAALSFSAVADGGSFSICPHP